MVLEVNDDRIPFGKQYVSFGILIINIVVFVIQLTDPSGNMYIYEAAFIPAEFFQGEKMYTIISAMFMHGDLFHIIGNMLFFVVIADNVEHELGHIAYLLTYILSGFSASILHGIFALLTLETASIPSLGASGGIFGIIAVYGLLFPNRQLYLIGRFYMRFKAKTFVIIYFVEQIIYAILSMGIGTGVAYLAHVGGFIMGAMIAYIYKKKNVF